MLYRSCCIVGMNNFCYFCCAYPSPPRLEPSSPMICPNCGSSRVRRSRRSLAEKILLPMLMMRPFRCEDCVSRFVNLLWRSTPDFSTSTGDANSLVYKSSNAALHSGARRIRKNHRKSKEVVTAWFNKPIKQTQAPEQTRTESGSKINTSRAVVVVPDPKPETFPQILGVILELKNEPS